MPAKRSDGKGTTRQLPSGRWQARFRGPDGERRTAPGTFDSKLDAIAWLASQSRDVDRGVWREPEPMAVHSSMSLKEYATVWLAGRDLKPRTRLHYQGLLDKNILPALGGMYLDKITPATVRGWHGRLNSAAPTRRAHSYGLLRTIMGTALSDDLILANPCRIRGAGLSKTTHQTKVASLADLDMIVEILPDEYGPLVLLAAWCALRFGELTELRRSDVVITDDVDVGHLMITRAVTRLPGKFVVGTPKSDAGYRTVAIPPHILSALQHHLDTRVGPADDALLFPSKRGLHLGQSGFQKTWESARTAAGRPDLRFHDLRHTGATMAAQEGATLAELMSRLGHTTPAAALIYQHTAGDRDDALARRLSARVTAATTDGDDGGGNVVPMRRKA
jgi:integrase